VVIPLLAAVLFGARSKAAAFAAIAAGLVTTVIWIARFQEPTGVDPVIVGASANGIVFAAILIVGRYWPRRPARPSTPAAVIQPQP
jgi:SSS family solute:Na+ symporter